MSAVCPVEWAGLSRAEHAGSEGGYEDKGQGSECTQTKQSCSLIFKKAT